MTAWHCTSRQIDAAVRKLYAKNGYVVLSEVRNGTGYEKRVRTADMVAISTWPSRGLHAEGFEIKVGRGDLRRELASPNKADEIAGYCIRWWLAVPDWLITEDMMIPETWGIITVSDKLVAKVYRSGALLSPKPWDALFCCSLLRNVGGSHTPTCEVDELVEKRVQKALKDRASIAESHLEELRGAVKKFNDATGINLLTDYGHPVWNVKDIGTAVSMILALRRQPLDEIARAKTALEAGMAAIDVAVKAMGSPELPKVEV